MTIKTSFSRRVFQVINYSTLIILSLCCLLPFVHLLAISVSDIHQVASGRVGFIPKGFNLYAYEFTMQGGRFFKAFGESIKVVLLGTAINLVMMVLTAYPLSKDKSELLGRNIYMTYFVITMLVGGGLIPTYLVVTKTGLKDTIWALVLPGALPVYNMIILMNFIRGLPKELQEAAKIDGASEVKVLLRVLLPLLKPSLATVALFSIVGHWNNWFPATIYMNHVDKYPLASYLQTLLHDFEKLLKEAQGSYALIVSQMNQETGRAAQMFLAAIPVLVVYPFLQKYFTTGLTLGSVKG